MPLFVSSYIQIMEAENPATKALMASHLVEQMGDAELYGWKAVCAFHAIWLQQLEHGCVSWADDEAKIMFCRALV